MTTDQPTLAVLKPCPFCGGEGEAVCLRSGEDSVLSWARCLKCRVQTEQIEDAYSDLASARVAWNTRTHSEPRPVAGLREAAERVQRRVGDWDGLQGWEPRDRFAAFGEALRHDAMALVVATLSPDPTSLEGGEGWQDIASAPKDGSTIILWAEVDGGNRGAAYGPVMAAWIKGCMPGGDDLDIGFGEDGGWLVSFTDDCIASAERPTHWMPVPAPPAAAHPSTQGV